MAQARLYKMITPPKLSGRGGGITVKIGGKTVTSPADGFRKNVSAINSLGATINSIAIVLEELKESFASYTFQHMSLLESIRDMREDHLLDEKTRLKNVEKEERREEGLRQDTQAEEKQEKIKPKNNSVINGAKAVAKTSLGFFEALASLFDGIFKSLVVYQLMDWLGKKENRKKVERLLSTIKTMVKWFAEKAAFVISFGLEGLTDFLENPLSFEGIFGLVKFLGVLGAVFAPVAMIKLGLLGAGGVLTLFRKGGLFKAIKGLFRGIGGMIKGLIGFVKGRGLGGLLVGAAVLGAGVGLSYMLGSNEEEEEDLEPDTEEPATPMSKGGKIPELAKGGWITGPQSGYPVSLDGGKSTSFIGHGTEYVATRSAGGGLGAGFVVPFDTPATKKDPGLTSRRIGEATGKGFSLPKFASGGEATGKGKGFSLPKFASGGEATGKGFSLPKFASGGDMDFLGNLSRAMGGMLQTFRPPEYAAGGLLDFIASGEGGYNSMNQGTIGNSIVGSTHDSSSIIGKKLTDMTVSEIIKRQDYLMNPSNPQKSNYGAFAVGRYQVIPGTMKTIVKQMGIDKNQKFDKKLQDKIGMGLIQYKRPYAWDYIKGKHNDRAGAMKALAAEWASLPDPATGKSMYGGGNASSHTVGEVAAALDAARGGAPMVSDDPNMNLASASPSAGGATALAGATAPGGATAPAGAAGSPSASAPPPAPMSTEDAIASAQPKKPMTAAEAFQQMGGVDLLNQYLADIGGMDKNNSGEKLSQAELKEKEKQAEGGAGGKVSVQATDLPPVQPPVIEPPPPVAAGGSGEYIVPANEYLQPRFGLFSDLSSTARELT